MNRTTDDVARILFDKFGLSGVDSAGNSTSGSYVVTEGKDGRARVAHRIPTPDLLDDDRTSDDELAAERIRMVAEYAEVLTAAGWTVEHRGPNSRRPYLLASRPA